MAKIKDKGIKILELTSLYDVIYDSKNIWARFILNLIETL